MRTVWELLIDLRSDTVTLPTPEMREAIARAELGDDVYGEDPTVNRLEATAAAMMGKEAGLLVPSGTMGNLIALLTHCGRGTKAIVGNQSHTYLYEAGGASTLGGIMLAPITNRDDGELDLDELEPEVFTANDAHFAMPSLVVLENTHNRCGGSPVKLSHLAEVPSSRIVGRCRCISMARGSSTRRSRWKLPPKEIASYADTVSFCLSKGLACPVGSVLCGSKDFIARAHRIRKLLGGGMRQAGIIAAAGFVALIRWSIASPKIIKMRARWRRGLRSSRASTCGRSRNAPTWCISTSMVTRQASRRFAAAMKDRGVLISAREATSFRAVTHYGITRADIDRTVSAASEAAAKFSATNLQYGFARISVWIARPLGLVTGASSGLGVECAHALALAGADVALVARRADRVRESPTSSRRNTTSARSASAPTSREADIDRAMAERAKLGDVDILVNNAGVSPTGRAENFKREAWDNAIAVNLTAPMMLSQRVARRLIETKQPGPHHQHGFDLRGGRELGLPPVGIRGDQGGVRESHPPARGRMGRLQNPGQCDRAGMDPDRSHRGRHREAREQRADGNVHADGAAGPARRNSRRGDFPCEPRFELCYRHGAFGRRRLSIVVKSAARNDEMRGRREQDERHAARSSSGASRPRP